MATFFPLSRRTVRWRPVEGEGLEHLNIASTPNGLLARSVLVGERGGAPYGIAYKIDCRADWTVRSFEVHSTDGRRLALASDGAGRWFETSGEERLDLAGCIDIDLSGTPFTNTLPIRRLDPAPSTGSLELRMLYVPFNTLTAVLDNQRYTALEQRHYRYEASDRSFEAILPVDEDGLVIDYPSLFRRVPAINSIVG